MDLSCLIGICAAAAQAVDEAAAESIDDDVRFLSEMVTWVGVAVLVLAQLLSPLVLRLYRRALLRLMGASAQSAVGKRALEPRGRHWPGHALLAAAERRRLRVLRVLIGVVLLYSLAAAWFYRFEFMTPRNQMISLAVSWFMFASFSAPVVLLGVSASQFARHFWIYFAPAAFAAVAMQIVVGNAADFANAETPPNMLPVLGAIALVTFAGLAARAVVPSRWWHGARGWFKAHPVWGLHAGAFAFLVLLVLVGGAGEAVRAELEMEEGFGAQLLLGCALATVAIGLCYVTLVDRSKRIVVPLMAAALFVVIALTMGGTAALLEVFAGPPTGTHMALAIVLALCGSALIAWFMLSWIGLAYDQKLFSDAQFQVFCWMISVAGVVIFVETLVYEGVLIHDARNLRLALATGVALLVYWVLTRWFVDPLRSDRRLLVLRVFAQDSRGERLLDALEYRWRFIGPIILIGGPDIAVRTIDPSKAANLLRFKLKRGFVPNRQALHKRIAAMDDAPDPDGRYRVNEFYCFDDLWKEAVEQLLDSSDAIVLDLRGFTAARHGTAYEIGLLARRGAVARTIFLVDASTDRHAVREAMRADGGNGELPPEQVIEVESTMRGLRLVEALVRRMPASRETAAPPAAGEPKPLPAVAD